MNFFTEFTVVFGSQLVIFILMSVWLFRTSSVSLYIKLIIPIIMVILACWTPYTVINMLGYPRPFLMKNIPDGTEILAIKGHEKEGNVDIWVILPKEEEPKAFNIKLTPELIKLLSEAEQDLGEGGRVILRKGDKDKNGLKGNNGNGNGNDATGNALNSDQFGIGSDDSNFSVDPSFLTTLPPKN
jgi:hypothetical protein